MEQSDSPGAAAGNAGSGTCAGLAQAIAGCRICRDAPQPEGAKPLPHEPRPVAVLSTTARILIAGQAPGLRVHDSGLPFNDASGNRLRDWLGVDRATFYNPACFAILPMGFCFPGYDAKGSDLPPRRECAPAWRQQCLDAMPQIELVLTVGLYAYRWHCPDDRTTGLTEVVAGFGDNREDRNGTAILALPHPSWRNTGWLKRNPWYEQSLLPYLRKRVEKLIL